MILISDTQEGSINDLTSSGIIRNDNNSKCFLSLSLVLERDEQEEMEKKAKEITDYIHEKYPEVDVQYFNFKDGKYSMELGNFIYTHPFVTEVPLNRKCVIESLHIIGARREFQDKEGFLVPKYYVYVYALIIHEWLGVGGKGMTQKDFMEWMNEEKLKLRKRSRFSDVLSALRNKIKFPNWNTKLEEAVNACYFEKEFIKLYWTTMMSKYHSLEEMKGAKTE